MYIHKYTYVYIYIYTQNLAQLSKQPAPHAQQKPHRTSRRTPAPSARPGTAQTDHTAPCECSHSQSRPRFSREAQGTLRARDSRVLCAAR